MKVSEKLGDYTTIRQSTVNYLGRTKADTSAVTGTKCLSKSNFPLIVNEKKRSKQKQGPTLVVLTIYMEKPEIPVGKSNGSRHSVWKASENMGCDLRRCSFFYSF